MVEVHSLLDFNASDIPHGKPPDQCLNELDNFIMKQNHFNERIQSQLHDNSLAIKSLLDVLGRTANDVKVLVNIFIWLKLSLKKILMCKNICLLTIPNKICMLLESKP